MERETGDQLLISFRKTLIIISGLKYTCCDGLYGVNGQPAAFNGSIKQGGYDPDGKWLDLPQVIRLHGKVEEGRGIIYNHIVFLYFHSIDFHLP